MNNNVKAIILALVASVSGVTMNVLIKFSLQDINVFTENLRKYDEHLYAELEPVILDASANEGQKDLTDLTYEEFLDLRDLALSLWHQSRRSEQIRLAGEFTGVLRISNVIF